MILIASEHDEPVALCRRARRVFGVAVREFRNNPTLLTAAALEEAARAYRFAYSAAYVSDRRDQHVAAAAALNRAVMDLVAVRIARGLAKSTAEDEL